MHSWLTIWLVRKNFLMIDVGVHVHDVLAHFNRHDHLFQRTVAGAFTDAVQGAFHLTGAGLYRGDGVADRHAQIVVAVHGDDGFVDVRHAVIQGGDDAAELVRRGVADGVRDIDGGGAGIDGGFDHAAQIVDRCAAGVFTGELYVVGVVAGTFDRAHRHLQHFVERAFQLRFNVQGRGGQEHVDAERFGDAQRFCGHVDVFVYAAGQGRRRGCS